MNKSDRKKINKTFTLLTQAVCSLKDAAASGMVDQGIFLLTNMQQVTIEIGNILEEKEQNCHSVIKKLETLCELYYQCSVSLSDHEDTEKKCALISSMISELNADIQKFPVHTEILFLPYQVSMWDSLESVWMAASQDNQADCYVVPLPVYDVLADGSLGKLHYEGSLYPDYVPVTPYSDYNIEKRHPDIIFFHNPYDDINTITRVPEQYYSRNLKKHTNLLVYIPYYMASENGPNERQCYTPGILFADKVIIQPGAVHQKICRIYTSFVKQNGFEQILINAKDKFLPFGSPKADKLVYTKCKIENLPIQWQHIIRKPNGERKKIVLYNLSISSLLANSEKIIQKIDDVLTRFKKLQDDIALLLRPHPLLEKTVNTMRPKLRDAYDKIIRQYKTEGWGIFDETPDANLAMAISDAYYGDYSSLLISYRILNKPMLIQNVDSNLFHPDSGKMQLWFSQKPALIDGELWFAPWEINGLYRYPLLSAQPLSECKLETRFVHEPDLQEGLYGDIIQKGDLIILPPLNAKAIIVFHTKEKQMRSYPLPAGIANIARPKYQTGFVYGNSVYFVGMYSDIEMLKLELDTGKIELCGCIPDRIAQLDAAEITGYCACTQQKIYIPLTTAHAIVEYNSETKAASLKKLPAGYAGQLKGIFHYTNNEFFILLDSKIISWIPDTETYKLITEYKNTEQDRLFAADKKVYSFELQNQLIYVYHLESGKTETFNCMQGKGARGISGQKKLLPICYDKGRLILFSLFYNKVFFIKDGCMEKEFELFTTDIPDFDFNDLLCQHRKTESCFYHCSLEHYLNYIIHRKTHNEPSAYENVGNRIYQEICSILR